jgi:hypothetical protein
MAVRIVERAYLVVSGGARGGSTRIKVTTPPLDIHGVGDRAWLELDPRQMAAIG